MELSVFGITLNLGLAWQILPFTIEILVAELLFLYPFERKKFFLGRYAATVLMCCLGAMLYESLRQYIVAGLQGIVGQMMAESLDNLLMYTAVLIVTIVGMCFCFQGRKDVIFYACTAGYAVQHLAHKFADIIRLLPLKMWIPHGMVRWLLVECVGHVIVYLLAYYIFARTAEKYNYKNSGNSYLNTLSVVIILIGTGINRFAVDFSSRTDMQVISDSLYAMTCCAFALIIQFSLFAIEHKRAELELSNAMLKEQGRQYNQWKANLETLNIQYHDLRHELNALKEAVTDAPAMGSILRLEQLIDESFFVIHTGNEMLDVLLASKKSICERNKINFTCTVDSKALSQMDSVELCQLFCNALDNAIEGVSRIGQEEKRVINLSIKQFGEFVDIHLQNYFEGPIRYEEGLPVTTNEEPGHGYGMKSMKRTAEKLGGAMSVHTEEDLFHLQFVIPTQAVAMTA